MDAIVRYLQPPPKVTPPSPSPASGGVGPERYYADHGEEPGRWLGRAAHDTGLAGFVQRSDFAAVLAGRDPHTDERLISAQGSAGRRPTLGSGAHTKVGADGEQLYDVADAAAALGVTHREVERMLDAGTAVALGSFATTVGPRPPAGGPAAGPARPAGDDAGTPQPPVEPPAGPPVDAVTRQVSQPEGSYLVPLIQDEGSRWVRASELVRCARARDAGVEPGDIRALGAPDDQIGLVEAGRLVDLTTQYLRGLARYHDEHRAEIARSLAAGRHPRRAFLVAHRGTRGRWLVTREHLAEFLERRRPPSVRVGYDLTLTTEKSLGVLALIADNTTRGAVLGSIQAGNDWALGWLEDHAARGRVEGRQVKADGWMVASFRHLTSRSLDPFPHHHNVVANTVRLSDGTHRALDARGLYQHAQAASALATAEMRHQLSEQLGVRWRPGRKSGWEVDGITNGVVGEFSKRRNEIDDALRELEAEIGRGAHPNEIEHIVLRTRPAKNHTPANDLIAAWRERAARHGLTPDALDAITSHQPYEQAVEADELFASLAGRDGICSGGSVFSRSEALAAMANHPVPTAAATEPQPLLCGAAQLVELTDQFLASPHVVALTDGDGPLYTTVEMLDVQDHIATRFAKGLHRGAHLVPDDQVDLALERHAHLTGEQRRLVTEWCQRGHRFQAAIGRAGAGKTTTVAACADAWTAAGYRVLGAAVKGEATRTLAAATGIECETVAWYLAHTDPESPPLDTRTILVVDEASTLSDRDLGTLMDMAAATGASLRLIGDTAQHGAIAAGGMFRVLCERHGPHTPELTTTHRLQDPHDRAAAQALREGQIDEAFDQLAAAGHLHIVADDLAMYRQVLGRWWDAHLGGLDHPMVDRRNSTRRQLNRLAHLLRRVNGELDGEEVAASGDRSFAVGDRVTARAPNRDLHVDGDHRAYIRNGALGTIVAVHVNRRDPTRDRLTVDFHGIGDIDVPRSFFDHHRTPAGRPEVGIDHAYALTSYAVQGSTRDISTSRVDATATRAETYVDITRGRHENHLYLTAATDPLDGEALPRVPPVPADLAVAERLHRSTGELTAWELAHPADEPQPAAERAVGI
ncbi:MobF family relaxase [Iamia majanohamensis]|uniref:MobF family relaxase n=1 Tax=Iamia majanohamensis TaxID=467976 RepID=A0AAE9Y9G5_9ACTN|nr:MobF family relaxase [Iamia majanohamensis]WCO69225.1 MobF family relaxase [Iamia majanohamensis]